MKNFIIKTNQWYESLPTTTGGIFYLSLTLIPHIILTLMTNNHPLSFLWVFSVAIWRISYEFFKDMERGKNKK